MKSDQTPSSPISTLPEGTVTFLFTDIEGSTNILKKLRGQYAKLMMDQRRIHRDSFNRWHGHEVGTEGDSFFVSFSRASDAVNAVVEIQTALEVHTWPEKVALRVRMGVHTGEPIEVGESDYIGIDVHRAARVAHLGHGGQVLLSETTTALVRDELPAGVSLLDLGQHWLKDFDRPEHVHQLVVDGLMSIFPPLKSLDYRTSVDGGEARGKSKKRLKSLDVELTQKASIVVLPFVNMSSEQENEYFSDGLTEEIIADLSKVHGLRVISRTSAMMMKNTEKDSRTIGRDLNVQYLLEGSVRKTGNRVRITAQLIDTISDGHLWADKYSGTLDDIFAIQESLSRKIVDACEVELSPEETRLVHKGSVKPAAHQAYLQGRYYVNLATPEGFSRAIPYFEEAIGIERNYALAYAGLATSYNYLGWAGGLPGDVYPKAKKAALKALEYDELLPEAHLELGYTATFYDWDWSTAEWHLERAIALNPSSSQAHLHYSWYLFSQLRVDESIASMKRASELDPLSMVIHMNLPNIYHLRGDYETMLDLSNKILDIAPHAITALLNAAWAFCEMELFDDAAEQFKRVVEITGLSSKGLLGYAYGKAGHNGQAQEILEELVEPPPGEYVRPLQIAFVYIGLAQIDEAFYWLNRSYIQRSSPLLALIQMMPMFHPLREDARYNDLLRQMNFR